MPESHFWFSPVTRSDSNHDPVTRSDSNHDSQGLGRCCFGQHGVPTAPSHCPPSRCCFVCHESENWVLHLELLRMLPMFHILLLNSPSFSACRQRPKGNIKSSNVSAVWSPLSLWLFLDFSQQFGSRLIASLEFCSGSCYAFGWSSVLGTHGDWNHIQRHWQSESLFFSPFQKPLRFLLTQMFIYHPPTHISSQLCSTIPPLVGPLWGVPLLWGMDLLHYQNYYPHYCLDENDQIQGD